MGTIRLEQLDLMGIISKYYGGKEQTIKTREVLWKELSLFTDRQMNVRLDNNATQISLLFFTNPPLKISKNDNFFLKFQYFYFYFFRRFADLFISKFKKLKTVSFLLSQCNKQSLLSL